MTVAALDGVAERAALRPTRPFCSGPGLIVCRHGLRATAERARLEYDARSILTSWGDRTASEAGLHDYGNKDWAGLTSDLYLKRWTSLLCGSAQRAQNRQAMQNRSIGLP